MTPHLSHRLILVFLLSFFVRSLADDPEGRPTGNESGHDSDDDSTSGTGLECYSCVKVSPPVLCAKSTDRDHPPCKMPIARSNRIRCENEDDRCIAVTQVHVGTVLNLFGCDTCESVHAKAPGAKCVECKQDLCNTVAPTSCDIV